MYVPAEFSNPSREEAVAFIRNHSFGILVYHREGQTEAVHSPFLVEEEGGNIFLYTHIARTPDRIPAGENSSVLCIFSGHHGYVSPALYDSERNVPTWNYSALHIYGSPEELGPEWYDDFMNRLALFYDPEWAAKKEQVSRSYIERLYRGIILLRIRWERFDFANKLSQNKTAGERQRIAEVFRNEGLAGLADDMLRSLSGEKG